jgi:hypothetical protein
VTLHAVSYSGKEVKNVSAKIAKIKKTGNLKILLDIAKYGGFLGNSKVIYIL